MFVLFRCSPHRWKSPVTFHPARVCFAFIFFQACGALYNTTAATYVCAQVWMENEPFWRCCFQVLPKLEKKYVSLINTECTRRSFVSWSVGPPFLKKPLPAVFFTLTPTVSLSVSAQTTVNPKCPSQTSFNRLSSRYMHSKTHNALHPLKVKLHLQNAVSGGSFILLGTRVENSPTDQNMESGGLGSP